MGRNTGGFDKEREEAGYPQTMARGGAVELGVELLARFHFSTCFFVWKKETL